MSDFQSFRDAVLEDEDLQEQVISIVKTTTANGAGLEENIVTLAKNHGYTATEDDVTQHADFLGQDGDLTDFELEMISGGGRGGSSGC
jgi:predicted ribosomally synthesized peptide with nif11-like leader